MEREEGVEREEEEEEVERLEKVVGEHSKEAAVTEQKSVFSSTDIRVRTEEKHTVVEDDKRSASINLIFNPQSGIYIFTTGTTTSC